jgi:hypothetical protein
MAGKQARILSAEALSQLLAYAARTRQPGRKPRLTNLIDEFTRECLLKFPPSNSLRKVYLLAS